MCVCVTRCIFELKRHPTFVFADCGEDGEARMPLSALFKEAQLRPLDELVEQIRPMVSSDLDVSVRMARRKAEELQEEFPNLTEDERAMLTLYTIEMFPKERSLYFVMNQALRALDRKAVQPWRDMIWLLLTAMRKLPRVEERIVQRGVIVHSSKLGNLKVNQGFNMF